MNDNVVRLELGQSNTVDVDSPPETAAGYYYHTDELTKLREALVRSMLEPMVVNVVIGAQGCGKTVLLEQLLQQSVSDWSLCLIQANHALGAQHIIDQLNSRYFPHQAYSLHELADHFLLQEKNTIPVILVDDAHNLSSFALEVLLYLKHALEEQDRRCGIVLFARSEIRQLLSSHSLARYDESLRIIDLPLFSQAQTSQYIQQLISNAGIDEHLSLSPAQQLVIYRRSQGRASRINELVTQIAQQQINGTPWHHIRRWLRQHQRYLLLAGLLLVIMITVSSRLGDEEPPAVVATVDTDVVAEPTSTLDDQQQQISGAVVPLHPDVEDGIAARQNRQADTTPLKASEHLQHQLPQPQKKNDVVTAVNSTALPPAGVQPQVEKPAPSQDQPVPQLPADQQPAVEQLGERAIPIAGEAWLLAQAGSDYTVQLAASGYGQAIERFIGQQPALDELRYVKVKRRGEDWYVVLFGAYSTVSAAKKAIDSLPPTLSKNDPWVRRISRLQAMLPQATPQPANEPPVTEPVEAGEPVMTQPESDSKSESQPQPEKELPVPVDKSAPATDENAGVKSVDGITEQPVASHQVSDSIADETDQLTRP